LRPLAGHGTHLFGSGGRNVAPGRRAKEGSRMRTRHVMAAIIAALLIASLASWMFADEDPPPGGEPAVLEAG
jgi:hypothetical protein